MERMVSLMSAESPRSSQPFIGHNTLAALFGSSLPISISVPAIKNDWAMSRMHFIGCDESHVRSWLPVSLGFILGTNLLYKGVKDLAAFAQADL